MQAVIMAGGKGTRLAALTNNEFPKPMVPVLGKPLLERQIEQLAHQGICDIILVIGHLGQHIREYFSDGSNWNVSINYIEEVEPLGTAGAFFYIKEYLRNEAFFLVFGDVLFDIDLHRMMAFHQDKHSKATLFVHPNTHPYDSDLVILGESGRIVGFDSKHNVRDYDYDNCVNAGLYIFDPSVCVRVQAPSKKDLEKDLLNPMIQEGVPVFGYQSSEYIKDIGTVDRITQATYDLQKGVLSKRCLRNAQRCFIFRYSCLSRFLPQNQACESSEEVLPVTHIADLLKILNHSQYLSVLLIDSDQDSDAKKICTRISTQLGKAGVYFDAMLAPDKSSPRIDDEFEALKTVVRQFNLDLEHTWLVTRDFRETVLELMEEN